MTLGANINQLIKQYNQTRLELKGLKDKKQALQGEIATLQTNIDAKQATLDSTETQLVAAIKALP